MSHAALKMEEIPSHPPAWSARSTRAMILVSRRVPMSGWRTRGAIPRLLHAHSGRWECGRRLVPHPRRGDPRRFRLLPHLTPGL